MPSIALSDGGWRLLVLLNGAIQDRLPRSITFVRLRDRTTAVTPKTRAASRPSHCTAVPMRGPMSQGSASRSSAAAEVAAAPTVTNRAARRPTTMAHIRCIKITSKPAPMRRKGPGGIKGKPGTPVRYWTPTPTPTTIRPAAKGFPAVDSDFLVVMSSPLLVLCGRVWHTLFGVLSERSSGTASVGACRAGIQQPGHGEEGLHRASAVGEHSLPVPLGIGLASFRRPSACRSGGRGGVLDHMR